MIYKFNYIFYYNYLFFTTIKTQCADVGESVPRDECRLFSSQSEAVLFLAVLRVENKIPKLSNKIDYARRWRLFFEARNYKILNFAILGAALKGFRKES